MRVLVDVTGYGIGNGYLLVPTPLRPNALLWLFRCTNMFKFRVSFRVSIRFMVKLDYIRLDSVD